MADPRVVTGFKPLTKRSSTPLVVEKSSGNLWDIDVSTSMLNGFGSCFFGHQPDFIKKRYTNKSKMGSR
jgi:glutamate-1-semialdehyde aminotransferase